MIIFILTVFYLYPDKFLVICVQHSQRGLWTAALATGYVAAATAAASTTAHGKNPGTVPFSRLPAFGRASFGHRRRRRRCPLSRSPRNTHRAPDYSDPTGGVEPTANSRITGNNRLGRVLSLIKRGCKLSFNTRPVVF